MKKTLKVFLVLFVLMLGVTVYDQARPNLVGDTIPLKAPGAELPPAAAVTAPEPGDELWDLAYTLAEPLSISFSGNVAVDLDEDAQQIVYSLWLDSVDAYALDDALTDYQAFAVWQTVLKRLQIDIEQLRGALAEQGRPDVDARINLVDPLDIEILYATAADGQILFDIVEQTPAGERISASVYPESANLLDNLHAREVVYVVNRSSKVFHFPNCSAVKFMDRENRIDVRSSHDHLVSSGYAPCSICNP